MQTAQTLLLTLASMLGVYLLWCGYSYSNRALSDTLSYQTSGILPVVSTEGTQGNQGKMMSYEGLVEIRHYERVGIVEGLYRGVDAATAFDLGLQDIGAYLLGKNSQSRKLPMTIPISVSATSIDNAFVVGFVLPENEKIENLPLPLNKKLKLRQVPPRLMACLQWKGNFPTQVELLGKIGQLLEHLEMSPYESKGEFTLFQYDSPYSPSWMRKNEVLLEVVKKPRQELP